ncbi:hypothetical protein M378DRAFT_160536 [Amanita muscaria Koide BX008]|uniref:Uncharacterized protein n=1 Tax=Amanita muscaria (strain Koide BX008) TaxID=946122 RepID=A0A0C2XB51_AMAMK|nr:hypothetical protein M378DRAFT_160536 [Amanita muscaria Koide BX008]
MARYSCIPVNKSTSSSDSRCPNVIMNQRTSTMFESSREFQISGASVASLSGNSNTVNYFPVIFTPQRDSSPQQSGMETTRNNEYDELSCKSKLYVNDENAENSHNGWQPSVCIVIVNLEESRSVTHIPKLDTRNARVRCPNDVEDY